MSQQHDDTSPDPRDLSLMQWHDGELAEAPDLSDQELRDKQATMDILGTMLRNQAEADERGAGIADVVMARLDEAPHSAEVPMKDVSATPAAAQNDNSRTIFGLAALAAAAAAGLFVWGQSGADEGPAVAEAPAPMEAPAAPSGEEKRPPEAHPADMPSLTAMPEEEEPEPAVEVASVDFGKHHGSVFYVSGAHAAQTAVVWVTDEDEL